MQALDLFSGPGGLSLGMKAAGIQPIASVEKNKDAVATYAAHTSTAEHFCADVRTISFNRYRGKVDVIFGGPPCQPFSTGGLRRGTADARNMFPEFIRALNEVKPAAFLAENVPGLATRDRIHYLSQLLREFELAGYNVTWQVVMAADYGVPQKRRRVIIVGMKEGEFWFPKPTHGPKSGRPYVASGTVVSKDQPFGEPPNCPVLYAKYPDPRRSPYAGHVYNGGGRPVDLDAPCHTILASAGGYKTHWIDTLDIAPGYTAHLLAGGTPREGTVPGARRLTREESALLQTFPRGMRFAGSVSSQYTQIGDAVPPLLGQVLAKALKEQMEGHSVSPETHFEPDTAAPLLAAAS
ncbi:DNA cytosine methyltransferase [Bradyrhizobium sp. SZCCHNR2035]|uniref:DNA cytosine methyltransferase n=1 Tax=Bradyrhizobium sp. SZCCHNR2035 TaxID=3057386 RepID=UPI002915CEBB|nr:DNA cytosine methyltransferase [Bradyrhizobium sp. SZCCHNR2035]